MVDSSRGGHVVPEGMHRRGAPANPGPARRPGEAGHGEDARLLARTVAAVDAVAVAAIARRVGWAAPLLLVLAATAGSCVGCS